MEGAGEDVYCTLLMSDSYLPGALVLAHSLLDSGTRKKLAVLVTLDNLHYTSLAELQKLYDYIIPVERIVNKSPANLYLMDRPDLNATFTKIALWRQQQFRKIVYIDADVVTLRAPDELFELDTSFAAVPDVGWPDCFNSGVMVLNPNLGDFYALLALAQRGVSFDGADQGLLNMHFTNWHRLSFRYNCTPSGHYQYVPAYRHFQSSLNMIHFIGHEKPWLSGRDAPSSSGVYEELLARWWAVHDRHMKPIASSRTSEPTTHTDAGHLPTVSEQTATEDLPIQHPIYIPYKEAQIQSSTPTAVASTPTNVTSSKEEPQTSLSRFSPPMTEWDPSRAPPPADSKPEALNFPQQSYSMSADGELFRPPNAYPEPPKGMYYEVPKTAPKFEPKPLFPWEHTAAKPTRVFADDLPSKPEESSITPPLGEENDVDTASPTTPTINIIPPDAWQNYTRSNAWDDVPEIERYITSMQQARKGRVQVLLDTKAGDEPILSPSIEAGPARRKASLRLTDFPSEVERPSLPVTPAPIRRPSFWGEERNEEGELPAAEGVPKQEEWNPAAKLDELLRRQSEVLMNPEPVSSPPKPIPNREMPSSSVDASKPDFAENKDTNEDDSPGMVPAS
ncbi:glycosyltransferase family 8 protein [Xylona heveae TC161]|uniref:glycogenin glucosyltransferase n=1 Tax=Xylona heveae (strain CBS 132557 / TC161) TaxID=1328760 RepID=A0A165GI42_XYLHT|nr:glycosyltransferase family 8 protein [Xylona heveae TC161]KZF22211.1 glycosyltransferase family 8 protein [Xylona heveae TC161]